MKFSARKRARATIECQISDTDIVQTFQAGSNVGQRAFRDEPGFLTWLQGQGLRPRAALELSAADPQAGVITLSVAGGDSFTIGEPAAADLWVADAPPAGRGRGRRPR